MSKINKNQSCSSHAGTLYIVATPIGNLRDLSERALTTLKTVDYIAAEDTRHSAKLLQHFAITTPIIAYHDYSHQQRIEKILADLCLGQQIALISDAGTPLISDPGYTLVHQARMLDITVSTVPGPCALISALSIAGVPTDRFVFEGFLPTKKAAKQGFLNELRQEERTVVVYESPHRLCDTLLTIKMVLGERWLVIARELTKMYETVLSGTAEHLLSRVQEDINQQRGEFVLLIKGCEPQIQCLDDKTKETMTLLLEELPIKKAAAIGARLTGVKKRDLYQWAIARLVTIYPSDFKALLTSNICSLRIASGTSSVIIGHCLYTRWICKILYYLSGYTVGRLCEARFNFRNRNRLLCMCKTVFVNEISFV